MPYQCEITVWVWRIQLISILITLKRYYRIWFVHGPWESFSAGPKGRVAVEAGKLSAALTERLEILSHDDSVYEGDLQAQESEIQLCQDLIKKSENYSNL
jgi:hypothetical protein